jgi:hypothetical protein
MTVRLWVIVRCRRCDETFRTEAQEAADADAFLVRCVCDSCSSGLDELLVREASAQQIAQYDELL